MASSDFPVDIGQAVGRTFVDKLLLAIIDANPEPATLGASEVSMSRRRLERLREAKLALFGESNSEGRPREADQTVLRWMGQEHYRDLAVHDRAKRDGLPKPRLRSARKLAREACARFDLPENANDRLRGKFADQRQKWLDVAMLHDDVPEQVDYNLLASLQEILARRGIEMSLKQIER